MVEEGHKILNKKSYFILLVSLLITGLVGCGGGGGASTSSSGAQLQSISITPVNPTLAENTSQQLTATGIYADNTTQDLTSSVTWTSSDSAVAVISSAAGSNGLAIPAAAGSTTITARSGSISGTATLSVTGGTVVTLTWDAPTTNTDGSPLNPATDLTMYKIYYGTAPQTYTQVVNVANPGTTTISKTLNLSPGTYYFVVSTVDTSGKESSYSNEAMKTI
jgi:hypothetical protein